jgi:mRNA-degrading endonuclease RelE of RelBE toxin-antitoxin system
MAAIRLTDAAKAGLDCLPRTVQARMVAIFRRLRAWPAVSGAKPLRGSLAGHYRMRTGDYRLRFRVEGEEVVIEQVGHRDRFYQE